MGQTIQNLSNALIKLERSIETGVDPVSGFTTQEILDWIEENQPLEPVQDVEWEQIAKAALRRLIIRADSLKIRNRQIRDLRRALRN